ncbi:MAG: dihydrolipoyllysine-residue acetyltransferase [Cellvibrionaceae bacterium]|nr:dihydrolipoyllysine-residue acetyltransferase [Cellvibrionaceae bacterium]
MAIETIKVPDIGGAENVDVIEVCVAVGDVIKAEASLIVLESDKASMDIPAPKAGKVVKILLKEGDQVSEGAAIIELETDAVETAATPAPAPAAPAKAEPAPVAAPAGAETTVVVPDIGGAENVDIIEVCVKVGQDVKEGESLIVLESDKASMEIPAPASGKVVSLAVKEGDKVSAGSKILVLSTGGGAPAAAVPVAAPAAAAPASAPSSSSSIVDLVVPDIGGAEGVDVIEVCVKVGAEIKEGDSLIVLESDKASMEIPASASGKVIELVVKEGDKVSKGAAIGRLQVVGSAPAVAPQAAAPAAAAASAAPAKPAATTAAPVSSAPAKSSASVYAGPAVRKLARQLGVELTEVKASGPRGRVIKDDVRNFVKSVMENRGKALSNATGSGIPAMPEIDFSQFGQVELVKMSKIKKVTAFNMTRNWLNIPAVTQFDDADITEMENFRKAMKDEADKAGVKLTPVPFLLKACAAALKAEPSFNVSLHADGEHIVQKKYIHIGMAVDTPNGLVVPVIRDVDRKGLFELAAEAAALAKKAREGKLLPKEMQGGCFTISSLGAIGGTGFTPIVNAPEVGILGVSRADTKPVWDGKAFVPRLMLPLCLSYDHRAINGGDAGRFLTYLGALLSDVRRLLL